MAESDAGDTNTVGKVVGGIVGCGCLLGLAVGLLAFGIIASLTVLGNSLESTFEQVATELDE